jgi:hypothetical protein
MNREDRDVVQYSKSEMDAAQLSILLKTTQDRVQYRDGIIRKKNGQLVLLILFALLIIGAAIFGMIQLMRYNSMALREQREGLYTISALVRKESPSYAQRMEIFYLKGKKVILDFYEDRSNEIPRDKRLTNDQIDRLLRAVFRYSEQYMVDPWLPMAFMRCESWFVPSAVSSVGAVGLYQFMPFTAKSLFGTRYCQGWETDIEMITEGWFRLYLVLSAEFNGDLRWIAAAYVAGEYFPSMYYRQGKSFESYQIFFSEYSPSHSSYMEDVWTAFEGYKSL